VVEVKKTAQDYLGCHTTVILSAAFSCSSNNFPTEKPLSGTTLDDSNHDWISPGCATKLSISGHGKCQRPQHLCRLVAVRIASSLPISLSAPSGNVPD
jgi:hypothetical protein